MIPWWLWFLLAIGLLAFLSLKSLRPTESRGVTVTGAKPLLDRLVMEGIQESLLVLERESAPGLLQLRFWRRVGGAGSIELGLPFVDWSAEKFYDVTHALDEAGYSVRVESTGSCNAVRRFLRVSVSGPTSTLTAHGWRLLSIARDSLGWNANAAFTVHIERPMGAQLLRLIRRRHRASKRADETCRDNGRTYYDNSLRTREPDREGLA